MGDHRGCFYLQLQEAFELRINPPDIAEQHLLAATLALATARNSSTQEHIYIEWIAQPSMPDEPLRPRTWWNVFLTFLIAAGSLWIVRSLSDLVLVDD